MEKEKKLSVIEYINKMIKIERKIKTINQKIENKTSEVNLDFYNVRFTDGIVVDVPTGINSVECECFKKYGIYKYLKTLRKNTSCSFIIDTSCVENFLSNNDFKTLEPIAKKISNCLKTLTLLYKKQDKFYKKAEKLIDVYLNNILKPAIDAFVYEEGSGTSGDLAKIKYKLRIHNNLFTLLGVVGEDEYNLYTSYTLKTTKNPLHHKIVLLKLLDNVPKENKEKYINAIGQGITAEGINTNPHLRKVKQLFISKSPLDINELIIAVENIA